MKILVYGINGAPELTGIGKYSGELCDWLAAKGHEVRMISAPPYYPDWKVGEGFSSFCYQKENKNNFSHYRCPVWVPRSPNGLKRILHLLSFAVSSLPVFAFNCLWRPDLILVVEPSFFYVPGAIFISKILRLKAWLHIQDFEIDVAFELGILKGNTIRKGISWFERRITSLFDRVSTISSKMVSRLEDKGVDKTKILYFPNWVDTNFIYPLEDNCEIKKSFEIVPEKIVALYSGNMGEKQGVEIIIEAAKILKNEDIVFVLCGNGASYEKLKKLGEGLKNLKWLTLQPYEKLNSLLNLADIHLLPQKAEAEDLLIPSKLTGILASGRPAIATVRSNTQVGIFLQNCGLIVDPGDISSFVENIQFLARDTHARKTLGRNARTLAEEHFGKESILLNIEKEMIVASNKIPRIPLLHKV